MLRLIICIALLMSFTAPAMAKDNGTATSSTHKEQVKAAKKDHKQTHEKNKAQKEEMKEEQETNTEEGTEQTDETSVPVSE